jgi:diadenylate cyclase
MIAASHALRWRQSTADGGFGDWIGLSKALVELTIFALLFYAVLRFLWATRGTTLLKGLGVLLVSGVVLTSVLVHVFHLDHVAWLVEHLAPSVVLGLVVVFHPEIRRAIVQLGDVRLFRRLFQRDTKVVPRLVKAIERLSQDHVGALIAIERDASLSDLTENGHTIDAELNSFLIESIFFPNSALHDGGVIVRGDRIVAASCLFPLSQNQDLDKRLGTRHRAALGLAEDTDAFVIVVSEETGKVSVASGGKLHYDLTVEQLMGELNDVYGRKVSA